MRPCFEKLKLLGLVISLRKVAGVSYVGGASESRPYGA